VSRPERLHGFGYRGAHRYFLTFCTRDRRQTFHDAHVVVLVIAQIRRIACESGFVILAYCVMPDHAHLLVEGTAAAANLREFVKRAKQASGQAYARTARRPLWQEGYYERVVRQGDDARRLVRYIVDNPVRAGLVRVPAEYPHLGSDLWSRDELLASL
jgi:REP element-mobilizing transposase RayT